MNDAEPLLTRTGRLQRDASDPHASAWVSANAGSGKTYVLTRRVIRLLLQGADPSKILCLTFTKAAAAEMTRRVFDLLSGWTECDDDALAGELETLLGGAPQPELLVRARKLFAKALETPGGLKIQTIHAFCEALLQRFPIEADVPGHFRVLDEKAQSELLDRAKAIVFATAARDADDTEKHGFSFLLDACTDHVIDRTLSEIIAERHILRGWMRRAGTQGEAVNDLKRILQVKADATIEKLDEEIGFSPNFSMPYIQKAILVLGRGGKTDADAAARMSAFLASARPAEKAQCWVNLFQTKAGEWRATAKLITKAAKLELPDFTERAEAEILRLEALVEQKRALAVVDLTAAFLAVGSDVVKAYDEQKTSRGYLDFEDLIVASLELLSTAEAAQWVQYKLDSGIDHILVDEAQDTSARQWEIVRALAAEFFSGEGARQSGPRTLFAVGDEKQSIYSFQGADPKYFFAMRRHFLERARDAGELFRSIALRLSFRSTPDVLSAVDRVFADPQAADGLTSEAFLEGVQAEPILHDAVRASSPGEVAVWPMFADEKVVDPDDWSKPIDVETPQSAKVRLAERIAAQIRAWIDQAERLPGTGALITPGDILVLVRKRDAFVAALVRALKSRGIAVAGSDRLNLTDHIAILDLIALGQIMVLRQDDLSLAAVLKSPLFNWSEDDLFKIAHDRPSSLWRSLEAHAGEEHGPSAEAFKVLTTWMASADFERPFEFFSNILDRDGGRRKFKARFGGEVDDVLDQFTRLALDMETSQAPSLDRFLADLQSSQIVIKRELDSARSEVRIMTVHGAKGLEAPVVFLVDPGSAPRHASHDPAIMKLDRGDGSEILSIRRTERGMPALVARRLEAERRAGEQEYRRLLYVALTRARDRLIVCGYQGLRGANAACWHMMVTAGLREGAAREEFEGADAPKLVWRKTAAPPAAASAAPQGDSGTAAPVALPDWIHRPAELVPIVRRLSPSEAIDGPGADEPGPKIPPRDLFADALSEDSWALRRGRLIHRLLEVLPDMAEAERRGYAEKAAEMALEAAPPADRQGLADAVLALLADPRFAALFSTAARAEVSLTGWITQAGGARRLVSGQIDRLLVTESTITLVDYKTNRVPPKTVADAPQQYVAQLALYRRLLSEIYPNHVIEAALLWTSAPTLMFVPAARLDEAMHRITSH